MKLTVLSEEADNFNMITLHNGFAYWKLFTLCKKILDN